MNFFTALAGKSCSLPELAGKLETSERGLDTLLNALVAMGLLSKDGGHYSNAPLAETFLDKNNPDYVGHIIMHHHHLVDGWAQLAEVVKTGQPAQSRSHGEEQERESFQMGRFNLASGFAPTVAKSIKKRGQVSV